MNLITEMRKNKSEAFQHSEVIYRAIKDQSFDDFNQISTAQQMVLMFYFFMKFDKILTELYLNLKIILHLTILTYLSPKLQDRNIEAGDKLLVSGNSMVTFFKKFKLLAEALHDTLPPRLVVPPDEERLPLRRERLLDEQHDRRNPVRAHEVLAEKRACSGGPSVELAVESQNALCGKLR